MPNGCRNQGHPGFEGKHPKRLPLTRSRIRHDRKGNMVGQRHARDELNPSIPSSFDTGGPTHVNRRPISFYKSEPIHRTDLSYLLRNCFQQSVAGIGEELDVDLGGHFIGEFEELSAAANWH